MSEYNSKKSKFKEYLTVFGNVLQAIFIIAMFSFVLWLWWPEIDKLLNSRIPTEKVITAFEGKPKVEITNTGRNRYRADVTEFEYRISIMLGHREVKGEFDKLDKKLFDKLQSKVGVCDVYFLKKRIDKYGNSSEEMELMCTINIDELNKYQSSDFWHEDGGILALISSKSNIVIPYNQ